MTVEPWTLIFADEGPYLYGRCVESTKANHIGSTRVFNIARMRSVKRTKEPFVYPLRAEHDPSQLFRHCFTVMVPAEEAGGPVDVVLRFVPSMACYLLNHRIHVMQAQPVVEPDGHVVVRMKLHITYDLVRWIRGHGRTVEVVEPANLRAWVVEGVGGEGYRRFVMSPMRGRNGRGVTRPEDGASRACLSVDSGARARDRRDSARVVALDPFVPPLRGVCQLGSLVGVWQEVRGVSPRLCLSGANGSALTPVSAHPV